MRNLFLLMLLAYCGIADMQAQDKTMIGEKSSVWSYYVGWSGTPSFKNHKPNGYLDLVSYGTTEIKGKTYHPIYLDIATHGARALEGSPYFPTYNSSMVFAIREEGGRVYVDKDDYLEYWHGHRIIGPSGPYKLQPLPLPYPVTDEGEVVLYDFNMQVGEKYPEIEGQETVFVERIDLITCGDNTERKLFHLSNGCDIIEGIGAVNGTGFLFDYLTESTRLFVVQYLAAFHKDVDMDLPPDSETFANPIYYSTYEYALEQSKEIIDRYTNIKPQFESTDQDNNNDALYDLQGRRLTAMPQRGVYIRDGRKYVVEK